MPTDDRTRQERVEEQTEVRRALLRNGYSPFPCEGKNGQLTGWPSIVATEALIDDWAEQKRWVSTAVHAGRDGLVGLDVDIDDAAVLEAFERRIPEDLWKRLESAPRRLGGGVKEMWLVRLRDGEAARQFKMTTGKWGDPAADEDETDHKLEIWAQEPKLLALFGARTVSGRKVVDEYSWVDGRGPDTIALGDLPEVGVDDLDVLLRCAVEAMQAAGWDRLDIEAPEGDGSERVFDLEDGMTFKTRDHGDVSLSELVDLCGSYDEVRMYSWMPGRRRRADRCAAKLNDFDGLLQIHDFDTGLTHRVADAEGAYTRQIREGARDAVLRLAEKLGRKTGGEREAGREESAGDGGDGDGGGLSRLEALAASVPEESRLFGGAVGPSEEAAAEAAEQEAVDAREFVVQHLLDRFAYWSDGSGYVVDIHGGPEKAMSMSSFRNLMLPWSWKQKRSSRANAAEDVVNPADVWLSHPERKMVGGYRFTPVSRERLVEVRGDMFVNIWERPRWWDDGGREGSAGAVKVFQAFLAHLIPDEAERDWFVMWLAAKVQKPWLPNCGVLMVAEKQGAGRGTLFDMLGVVFGQRHVKPVSAVQLIGGGSQSQYTDWLEAALLVTCDEVLAGDDAGGAMAWKRREVYERLKALVDPRARWGSIVRKGLPNYETEIYASYLLATNNPNALPLSVDDRRFAVITNTARKLVWDEGLMALLEPWRCDLRKFSDEFGAGVYGWLLGVSVDWSVVRESPVWMAGREAMLNANESDLDAALDNVLRGVEGDYVLGHHLRERLQRALQAGGLLEDTKQWWNKAQDVLSRPNRMGWRKMAGRHRFDAPKEQGSLGVTTVFYREEGPGEEGWLAVPPAARRGLWEGGEAGAKSSGRKVAEKLAERGLTVVQGGTPAE
jgi:hypothetical protein